MNYTEETALFACAGNTLVGILTKPEKPAATGVLVIVGGPQYRVGSHRQFVLLSRSLGAAGYAVLRFDYRGMGDSEGEHRDFETVSPDLAAAIDVLQQRVPAVNHVVLWGLCDGASAALLYCHETRDTRVRGLCLLNPWIRSEASLAHTQVKHYYVERLRQKEFWTKLLRGGVSLDAVGGLMRNVQLAFGGSQYSASTATADCSVVSRQTFQQRMATAWKAFEGRIFLLLSSNDFTAKEFRDYVREDAAWKNTLNHSGLVCHDLQGADHTFSSASSRARVEELTLKLGLHGLCKNT